MALSLAPQELFLDPSHTYRLWLANYRTSRRRPRGFTVRRLRTVEDAEAVNRIYASRNMVQVPPHFFHDQRNSRMLTYFVAVDAATNNVIGSVTGVDHARAFEDPENGSSLWCLAVDPQASFPGIGENLVRTLAEHFQARGRSFMDLSVMHDNVNAIALYEKLGFQRVPVFALKTKNSINEKLYVGPPPDETLNPYAMIIINEARRRGIGVEVVDAEGGYFTLSFGGRSVVCRESLSELTTAIAMSRCDDKAVTRRLMVKAGLKVPAQRGRHGRGKCGVPGGAWLHRGQAGAGRAGQGHHGRCADPGRGRKAVASGAQPCRNRAAGAVLPGRRPAHHRDRLPRGRRRDPPARRSDGDRRAYGGGADRGAEQPAVGGDRGREQDPDGCGNRTLRGGERLFMDDVLPEGQVLPVRKTANLHTGGTIHDVTDRLHRTLVDAAIAGAKALDIPVVGSTSWCRR